MKPKSILPLLLCTLALFAGSVLRGQDVGYYLNEMNTAPGRDTGFNAVIDSLWSDVQADIIDAEKYPNAVRLLRRYYDKHTNEITGDKAELYSYFVLLKYEDYPAIIDRFEARMGTYNHRAFTTIGDIYRRAYIRHNQTDLTGYAEQVERLAEGNTSEDFQNFLTRVMDLQFGQPAPTFEVTDLEGREYVLDSLRGKVVLLDFWATWCRPCVAEIPRVKELYEQYRDHKDFVMIGISLDDREAVWKKFVAERGLDWVQVLDLGRAGSSRHSSPLAQEYKALGVPKYILIDKQGLIRYNSHLANMLPPDAEVIERYLQAR